MLSASLLVLETYAAKAAQSNFFIIIISPII